MTAKFHTDPPPSDAHRPLSTPQTAEETIALLTASLTIVKARMVKRDECDECGVDDGACRKVTR